MLAIVVSIFCAVAFVTAEARPSARQSRVKQYEAGKTYLLNDVVNLNAEGNRLAVSLVKLNEASASIIVKIAISGEADVLAFTFGRETSDITLLVGDTRIAASSANFAEEIVASFRSPTMVSRFRIPASTAGMFVGNTTEHPLLVEFPIPNELTKTPRQLELKNFGIGKAKYSLIVKLSD